VIEDGSMFAISINRLQWSTFEIGQSGSIGASDGEQMLPNCPCSLTGEHVVISAKWSCCANWQKLQLILPCVTDHEGEHCLSRYFAVRMAERILSPEKRQGRICGLAWGGEVTPLGINCIALVFTLVRYRRA
jgi:hypothetical protein